MTVLNSKRFVNLPRSVPPTPGGPKVHITEALYVNRYTVVTVEPVAPINDKPRCIVTLPTKAYVIALGAEEVIRRLGFEIG